MDNNSKEQDSYKITIDALASSFRFSTGSPEKQLAWFIWKSAQNEITSDWLDELSRMCSTQLGSYTREDIEIFTDAFMKIGKHHSSDDGDNMLSYKRSAIRTIIAQIEGILDIVQYDLETITYLELVNDLDLPVEKYPNLRSLGRAFDIALAKRQQEESLHSEL